MIDTYTIPKGKVTIEYKHSDGTKMLNDNGKPIFNRMKPEQVRELIDLFNLEEFIVTKLEE